MIEIIPAIIPQNLNVAREKISLVRDLVKKIQIDIVDGKYANTTSWPFNGDQFEEVIKMVRGEENFPFIKELEMELDLFVMHPIEYLSDFISMGFKSFVIHIDSTDHITECIDTLKYANCKVGLGIKPSIETSYLYPHLTKIDFIQFMGNDRVGYNGVSLDENVLIKISNFHNDHPSIPIQIDIGVDEKTIPHLKNVGVSSFVSGSAIFNSNNPKETLDYLSKL